MFQDDKRYRPPVDIHATHGGRNQKLRTSIDHLHKPYINDSRGYFCDTADFNKSSVFDENEWNGNSYANGFFFNIFSRTSRHLCNSYYLCYFLLVSHDHLPSAIYRKWLDQSSMSVRSKYSITCNEHSFMWCNINTTCNIKNSGPRSYMHLFISFLVRSNTKMCELFSSSYLIS